MRPLVNFAKRRWPFLAAAAIVFAVAGFIAYDNWVKPPGDVTNANAPFHDTTEEAPAPPPKPKAVAETFVWPIYGYTLTHTRYLDTKLGPPFETLWKYREGNALIEFPPVIAKGVLYMVPNDGVAVAITAKTGRQRWRTRVGTLNASSPAYDNGRLFIVTLQSPHVTSLDAKTGKILWRKPLPSRSESSPIVVDNKVFFGSENGTVYALDADTGKTIWTYQAGGAVKASLAYDGERLYFGDYGGSVTALGLNGKRIWNTATSGRAFGQSGTFYSTPAVKYGRVYLGNTDGKVYSFVASTGQLAWSHTTSAYVYAAPSVARAANGKPTVYIGSYDGNFYALDARNGSEIWSYDAGGKISGSSTIVGNVVYFANLASKSTTGLDISTGKRVFYMDKGSFTPVVSDGIRLYLTGFSTQYALVPKGSPEAPPKHRRPKHQPARNP
jgi:outer membrane protein assembly factor BamB